MIDKLLICTDLDRTLIPNGLQAESTNARRHFSILTSRPEVTLVYVSGRDLALIREAIKAYNLPMPNFVIGDVGTSIYHVDDKNEWVRLQEWDKKISKDWNGKDHSVLEKALSGISGLRLQEESKQSQYKLSYYVRLDDDKDKIIAETSQILAAEDIQARIIWSVDEIEGIGLLDVLPAGASKLHAIEEIMRETDFSFNNTVFCGDSGNDIEVLVSPINSVLVANSLSEVKRQAELLAREQGNIDQLYIAKGGFAEMNGNYSAGMLEGVAYYYPETEGWMGL